MLCYACLPFMLVLLGSRLGFCQVNLFCQGDFEGFVIKSPDKNPYQNLTSSMYDYINNNNSCWYAPTRSYF